MKRAFIIVLVLAGLVSSLQAQVPNVSPGDIKAHEEMIKRLYPTIDLPALAVPTTSKEVFENAVRQARRDGIPNSLINQLAAMRAMGRADAAALQRVLPALQSDLPTLKPETQVFPEQAQAEYLVKTVNQMLRKEATAPGSIQHAASYGLAMATAREIRSDLLRLDSIRAQSRDNQLILVATWRTKAPPDSRLASTAADPLGNAYGDLSTAQPPAVPRASYQQLKPYVPDSFWAPFCIPN